MSNFNASNESCASVQCAVCEKVITGGNWFARITRGEWTVALCCPLCTEVFEKSPVAYIRRLETLEIMKQSRAASAQLNGSGT